MTKPITSPTYRDDCLRCIVDYFPILVAMSFQREVSSLVFIIRGEVKQSNVESVIVRDVQHPGRHLGAAIRPHCRNTSQVAPVFAHAHMVLRVAASVRRAENWNKEQTEIKHGGTFP